VFPHVESVYGIPNYPPLGLAYLSACLKKERIEHEILDLRLYANWKQRFVDKLLEGFSLVGISSTTFAFDKTEDLARIVKRKKPGCFVAVGGAHASLMKERILRENKDIDFVIVGEGEDSFVELCNEIKAERDFNKIKGLAFKKKNGRIIFNGMRDLNHELDMLPFPDYDKFNLSKYHGDTSFVGILKKRRMFPISTSRGCPFECIYCSVPVINGRRFRARSPENVIREIKYLIKRYNAKIIDFLDDNFTLDIERAKEICRLIIKNKLKIMWGPPNGIRVDRIDEELVGLMKKSGCIGVALGIESVDDEVLRNLKKHISFEQVERAVHLFRKYMIPVKAFFLVGSPGGSELEVRKALKFAIKNKLKEARFSMLTPYPGTELYDWVDKNKYWKVKNPNEEIIKYTHAGSLKSLYEEPGFPADEKERVYYYVVRRWEKYEERKDIGLKIRRWVVSLPWLYNLLKRVRDRFKSFFK